MSRGIGVEDQRNRTGVGGALQSATASMEGEKVAKAEADFSDAVSFVEHVTGVPYPGDLHVYLKDGTVLCKLINEIEPGTISKVNKPGMPFKEMENITFYVEAAKKLGCRNDFRPPDLYEKRVSYPKAIVLNLLNLERVTKKKRKHGAAPKKKFAYEEKPGSASNFQNAQGNHNMHHAAAGSAGDAGEKDPGAKEADACCTVQ